MKNRTIAQRLGITLGCLAAMFLIGLFVTLWVERRDNEAVKQIAEHKRLIAVTTGEIRYAMLQMSDAIRGMLVDPKNELERKRKLEADDNLVKQVELVKPMLADRPQLLAAIKAVGEFDEKTLNVLENKVMELITTDAKTAADYYVNSYLPQRKQEEQLLDTFVELAAQANAQAITARNSSHFVGMTIVGALVLFALLLGKFQTGAIQKILQENIGSLRAVSMQVTEAAGSITTTSQSLAEGAGRQAASIEETSASLEELTSMTKRNTENAQRANELAKQTRSAADLGAHDINLMSAAMGDIKTSSDDIAKIIKTIDEIAFQTNILALNAAVEAARAGEAGMGFAVVADEVRNLAQRSAQAAKETAAKIEGAIANTARGVQISATVTQALVEIVDKARQLDDLAAEVATASREQTQGISQINAAVGQMDQVTQNSAASAEESAAAAEQLNAQAIMMKHTVGTLVELVGVTADGVPPARPARTVTAAAAKKSSAPVHYNGNGHHASSNGHGKSGAARDEIPMDAAFRDF
ncbi:MAG: hypothetical protein RL616_47 [Verrucomicrobiota bacterium]